MSSTSSFLSIANGFQSNRPCESTLFTSQTSYLRTISIEWERRGATSHRTKRRMPGELPSKGSNQPFGRSAV